MLETQTISAQRRSRTDNALRHLYTRLWIAADRLRLSRQVEGLETSDLCQDGALAALIHINSLPLVRFEALDDDELRAIMFSVGVRTVRCKIVDFIRTAVRRRSQLALEPPKSVIDNSFERCQSARADLISLLHNAEGAPRRALEVVIRTGEIDASAIAKGSGLSRPYAYRILRSLSVMAQASAR